MISVSGKIWTEQKVNKNLVEKFKQDYGLGDILSRLIISRNYDISEIYGIDNDQKLINIFKDDKDFDKASLILINSINNNENICILGDYDVDGACATSLLVRYFNYIKQKHFFYIPDRTKDGYGASKKLFQKLILEKPKLIIMVDCGSTSNAAIDYLIYVLLATICDVMPLRKINRIIANNTIDNFNIQNNTALNYIFDQYDLKKKLTIDDLGFLIGPIINSGGRLNSSNYGVELLSTDNHEIIKDRSNKLIALNNKRKIIEQNMLEL